MTLGKLRRTIGTHSSIDHITILPRPTQTSEERLTTRWVVRTTIYLTVSMAHISIGNISMLPIIETCCKVYSIATGIATIILSSLTTNQSTEVMILDIKVVCQSIGPYQRDTTTVALVNLGYTITTLWSKLINRSK